MMVLMSAGVIGGLRPSRYIQDIQLHPCLPGEEADVGIGPDVVCMGIRSITACEGADWVRSIGGWDGTLHGEASAAENGQTRACAAHTSHAPTKACTWSSGFMNISTSYFMPGSKMPKTGFA